NPRGSERRARCRAMLRGPAGTRPPGGRAPAAESPTSRWAERSPRTATRRKPPRARRRGPREHHARSEWTGPSPIARIRDRDDRDDFAFPFPVPMPAGRTNVLARRHERLDRIVRVAAVVEVHQRSDHPFELAPGVILPRIARAQPVRQMLHARAHGEGRRRGYELAEREVHHSSGSQLSLEAND